MPCTVCISSELFGYTLCVCARVCVGVRVCVISEIYKEWEREEGFIRDLSLPDEIILHFEIFLTSFDQYSSLSCKIARLIDIFILLLYTSVNIVRRKTGPLRHSGKASSKKRRCPQFLTETIALHQFIFSCK